MGLTRGEVMGRGARLRGVPDGEGGGGGGGGGGYVVGDGGGGGGVGNGYWGDGLYAGGGQGGRRLRGLRGGDRYYYKAGCVVLCSAPCGDISIWVGGVEANTLVPVGQVGGGGNQGRVGGGFGGEEYRTGVGGGVGGALGLAWGRVCSSGRGGGVLI